jgi:hypothetical protein
MATASKRKRGERNPVHAARLSYLASENPVVDHGAHIAVVSISELFVNAAKKYLEVVDELEVRDEGQVTATLDALRAVMVVAHASVMLPYHGK